MPAAITGDTKAAGVVLRAIESRSKLYALIKPQAIAPASNPYESMTPDELRAEAHALGIYRYPHEVGTVDHHPEPATPPVPSANGTGTKDHSRLDWAVRQL